MSEGLRRYRRLIGLIAISLALHVLVIGTINRTPLPPDKPVRDRTVLAVRLQAPPAPVAPVVPVVPVVPEPIPPLPEPAPLAPALAPVTPLAPSLPSTPVADVAPAPAPVVAAPLQLPGRYRVRMPPSATLDYTVTRADGVQTPARIAWTKSGNRYTMNADGIPGLVSSTGGVGDNGVEPAESRMRLANGGDVVATFAPEEIQLGGRSYINGPGSQDPASLLLQLAGMGLASPDQLTDTVAIYVATPEGPVVMQFEVEDNAALTTPLGVLETRHLRQLAPAGQPRLEVWLAPTQRWLPVQLRVTAADGAVTTQTVTRIGDAGKPD